MAATYLMALVLTRGRFGWPGLRYFVSETLWVCLTQSILLFGWVVRPRLGGSSAAASSRPIVLVHGYTQNRTNFVWLSRYLSRHGLGPFFGFDYQSLQADRAERAGSSRSSSLTFAR